MGNITQVLLRSVAIALASAMLTACTTLSDLNVAPSPDKAFYVKNDIWSLKDYASKPIAPPPDSVFNIPEVSDLPSLRADIRYTQGKILDLPQLIDIAQRENPHTRQAWNLAREAALSVGLTDALFLPALTANVVSGEQRLRVPVNLPLGLGSDDIDSKARGTTHFVTLTWLLFDFGERDALREGAKYEALAANILFNASHQKVIRDVTDAYYRYNAASSNVTLAKQSLVQHDHVLKAVQARFDAGLATRVDIALARQALAQGRLSVVTLQGLERTSYFSLMASIGLPANSQLNIAVPTLSQLPSAVEPLTQQRIQSVVTQRADIAAAHAALKVAEAGKRVAEVAFLPKAYMGAAWASNNSSLQVGGLPSLGAQNATSGVLVGISMPLYDGGLRSTQLRKAKIAKEQAQQQLVQLHMTAVSEILDAEQVLQTALEGNDAAGELVRTATVAHDAALESYRVGRTNTLLLMESAIQLHKAQQVHSESQYAAVAAAANLAFVMGTMVSAQSDWWPHSLQTTENILAKGAHNE